METDNNSLESTNQTIQYDKSQTITNLLESDSKIVQDSSTPMTTANQDGKNPNSISINPVQLEMLRKYYEQQRMSILNQNSNYQEMNMYQSLPTVSSIPQNYMFPNTIGNTRPSNDNVMLPNNCYLVRTPTSQLGQTDINHRDKELSSPQPFQQQQILINQSPNQSAPQTPTIIQQQNAQGFQLNPNMLNCNSSFQNTGQIMQPQMIQIPISQISPNATNHPQVLNQNYINQQNNPENHLYRSVSRNRVVTPLTVSSPSIQDSNINQAVSFVQSQQMQDSAQAGVSNTQMPSNNNPSTPTNMNPHIIQAQNAPAFDPNNIQSKISMILNQIAQVQANINSLNNASNPQAAQIYQFLTSRLQQLRSVYYQLTIQNQQMQQQRNFMMPLQGNIPPQLANNPNAIAMLQQQIAIQNQFQQNAQMNPMIPRANLIQNPYLRMNQQMQNTQSMMPPGLSRFQGSRPPFMPGTPGFMMSCGNQPRMHMHSESIRGRRGSRGTRRRQQYSSESEEEEEITSSDIESTSQMTPSEFPIEDMELRRSSRRRTTKSYLQEFPEESDTEEKTKKDAELLQANAQDLIPFQPSEQIEGKLMLIERILADRLRPCEQLTEDPMINFENVIEEYYVKFKCFSYLHCEWCCDEDLKKRDRNALSKIKRYKIKKKESPFLYLDEDPFNPDYTEIDRILDVKKTPDPLNPEQLATCYLIKWCALPYDESTWEFEDVVDELSLKEFEERNILPSSEVLAFKPKPNSFQWQKLQKSPVYNNNNQLREYQLEGINWLIYEYYMGTNCILADEMGLGKTIQSIAFLIEVRRLGIRGPFLIIAPLSTIGNWYKEFQSWSDFNVVVFHGAAASRNIIHRYELYFRRENGDIIPDVCKFEVLITTYEMILSENKFLSSVRWRVAIVDEAHRLKNRKCKLLGNLSNIYIEHRVLLTGTPLQNTLDELLSLLNFLDPTRAEALEHVIQQNSGRPETNIQVQHIQSFLRPVILRRLKEDVEKNIAPKEETIIEVEMTSIQKKVYRGILERNLSFLSKGTSTTNLPNLMNIMMELRKCCNHPFLINGVEEKILSEYSLANQDLDRTTVFRKALVESSGKLVLVNKLLPKLRDNGHKMLIFSQMVRVLDLIEEYLVANNFLFERIDGGVRGNLRQAAIDRFSKPDSDRSVFLLCTKAGGLGINLTAADTVIIFDSDWNPQNDIQAQARCHRIGQSKAVKVYRLICRKTYEREMFDRASLKLGLDKAVLQNMSNSNMDGKAQLTNPRAQLSKKEVEELLRRGAYAAVMDEDTEASAKFCSEDIEQILERRATVIQIAGEAKGSTFAKASFNAEISSDQVDIDDPDFWQKWAKTAKVNSGGDQPFVDDKPRIRRQVRSLDDDSDVEFSDLVSEHEGRRHQSLVHRTSWLKKECLRVEKYLLVYGWGRWNDILKNGNFKPNITPYDVEQMSKTIIVIAWHVCKSSDHSFTDFVEKAIRLTALRNRHENFDSEDVNYRPYGKRTRNKKSRDNSRKKGDKHKLCLVQATSDWKNLDIDSLVFDQNYKKHLMHCASKILIRLRLLFYIEYYILRECKDDVILGVHIEDIIVCLTPTNQNTLSFPVWWDSICDRSLIVGTFKHGYEKYNLMKADKQLCFFKHLGAEAKSAAELNEGVVKRRGRKKKIVSSIESDDDNAIESQLLQENDETEEIQILDNHGVNEMPTIADLNTYLKRLVMTYWKNRSKTTTKSDLKTDIKSKWSRREESDFYRTIINFGIQRSIDNIIIWDGFRKLGRFDRKDDLMMTTYFETLIQRCNTLLSYHNVSINNPNTENKSSPSNGFLTLEKSQRILNKIQFFDLIRQAIEIPDITVKIKTAHINPELPEWWNHESDIDLLKATSMFGIDHADKKIFDHPDLSFNKIISEQHKKFISSNGKLMYTVIYLLEFVSGISDVPNFKDLSIEMIKAIIHWPKLKIITNRLYSLSMLLTTSIWHENFDDEIHRTYKQPIITPTPQAMNISIATNTPLPTTINTTITQPQLINYTTPQDL
ncbi:hypothetical protein HZS_1156 [Henneguya salminicola]|nr:hypothetical protein HZS_1156 [Henneguya salminicola]